MTRASKSTHGSRIGFVGEFCSSVVPTEEGRSSFGTNEQPYAKFSGVVMPSVYDLKPRFQSLLRPLVGRLAAAGVTANQVTIAAVVLSATGGALIGLWPNDRWPLILLPIVLLLRMVLNAIDGMLAREFGQKSRLGAVLNELGDVISDVLLYLPLAWVPELQPWSIFGIVLMAVIVEFTGVMAIQIGSDRRYDGPMGKSDRAFWIGLLAVLVAFGVMDQQWTPLYALVLIGLSVVTVTNRARRALMTEAERAEVTSPASPEDSPCPPST
jgi:CDP-diacylglycerol--glycerol-3-phosphate 3-phosphatidyltransferase